MDEFRDWKLFQYQEVIDGIKAQQKLWAEDLIAQSQAQYG